MAVVLAGCASPNTGPASSATSTVTGSATASPTSSSSGSVGAIVIDGLAKSTVNSLTVRAKPGTASARLGSIDAGQLGFVVAGPVSSDGYAWYQLSGLRLPLVVTGCEPPVQTNPFGCPDWLGWVAGGKPGGQPWIEAIARPCAASPMNLDALVQRTALELLACYRSTSIRLRAWWPEIPPDAGLGGACGAMSNPVGWLLCQNINYNGLVISESAGFESARLTVSIDPASGVTMPPRGQWIEVVAHLDDPAARDCVPLGGGDQDPVRVVLTCRSELVAESVKPVAGPY